MERGTRDGGPLYASRHDGPGNGPGDGPRHGPNETRDALHAARLCAWHAARHAHGKRCDACSMLMSSVAKRVDVFAHGGVMASSSCMSVVALSEERTTFCFRNTYIR